ncbi:beta strand repeat-containing protein [Alicyclobacillus sp. ALC3]|uniref:beta strand repeat-containing protein n=1 Tax=Alicyclobacillus sp. ALC3 TaxID=2796143 RepID=UPI002378E1A8|nr:putative Ig domain-containing protein [Alicyclobacillus sp. ALC3]WDL95290.1 putative Ig domain-containing protein [Alicyclobacillus sp. ALC3]
MRSQKEKKTGKGRRALNATTAVMITLGTAMSFATPQALAGTKPPAPPSAPQEVQPKVVTGQNGSEWVVVSSPANLWYIDNHQTGVIASGSTVDYLGANIELSGTVDMSGAGADWIPFGHSVNPFSGTFDGRNYTITGLTVSGTLFNEGFFGVVSGGVVENVHIVGSVQTYSSYYANTSAGGLAGIFSGTMNNASYSGTISGAAFAGGLVGSYKYGSITNSDATVTIPTEQLSAGGLVGQARSGTITNSFAHATLTGTSHATLGGLVGDAYYVGINDSHVYVTLTTQNGGHASADGGLVGGLLTGTIADSYATGTVQGANANGGLVGSIQGGVTITDSHASVSAGGGYYNGGLVGDSTFRGDLEISQSYAYATVSGGTTGHDGGLVGSLTNGSIIASFASATVRGGSFSRDGGLVGTMTSGTLTNVYATGSTSGQNNAFVGGLVGHAWQSDNQISYAYASETLSGGTSSSVGRLAGEVDTGAGTWTDVYTNNTSPSQNLAGSGALFSSGIVSWLTASQMTSQSAFVGFDFTSTWAIDPSGVINEEMPYLRGMYPTIDTTSLNVAVSGATYSASFAALGGSGGDTWSVAGLPTGLTINSATGVISGTATTAGVYTLTATVTDSLDLSDTRVLTLDVASPVVVTVPSSTTIELPSSGSVSSLAWTPSATGGAVGGGGVGGTYTWSMSPTSLDGLGLTPSGTWTGTVATTGQYSATLEATSKLGVLGSATVSLDVLSALVLKTTSALPEGEAGFAYHDQLSASGGSGNYTWALASGTTSAQTDGLSLSSSGVLSGDPTASGTFTFTATVSDGYATESRSFTLDVAPALVLQTTSPLPEGETGVGYQQSLSATGGSGSYTWALASGTTSGETDGLSLSSAGVLSGAPAVGPGTFTFTATVSDGYAVESRSFTLDVAPALSPLSSVRQTVLAGWPDTFTFTEMGGYGSYTWSLASGTLPPGYTLTSDGVLSGQSNVPGRYDFTVQVTDSLGATRLESAMWVIEQAVSPLTVQSITLGDGTAGSLYEQTLIANGGKPAYTWSLVSGSLPAGVVLNSDGVVQGTPTASGTYTFTVSVRDTAGHTATATDTLTVEAGATPVTPPVTPPTPGPPQSQPLVIGAGSLPGATAGTGYSGTLAASGGDGTYTWSLASGALPRGLMLAANGTLFGTPQTMGMSTFTLRVTDKGGDVATRTFHLFVMPKLLPAYDRVIEVNGQVFSLSPSMVYNQTTYMPIWYVQNVLKLAGVNAAWNGNLNRWDLSVNTGSGAFAGVTPHLIFNNHGTPVYVNGVLVLHAPTVAHRDPTDGVMTTYMPIWYVQQVLKSLGITTTWNGHVWNFELPGMN